MNKDYLKERISNYKDTRKNLWATVVVLTGGIVALTIKPDSFIKIFWFIAGIVTDLIFVYSIFNLNENIEKLLNKFDEV
jgi:hypothetical protein